MSNDLVAETAENSHLPIVQLQDLPSPDLITGNDDDECVIIGDNWKQIRTIYPEKWANYTITNKMYRYLMGLKKPTMAHEVVNGMRLMTPNRTNGKWFYPYVKGTRPPMLKGRIKGKKLMSTIMKEMMETQITQKNALTGKMETATAMEHLTASIIKQAIKGNFRHANIVLERVEGKVPDTINNNITMGIGAVLKQIEQRDDGHVIDHGDEDDGDGFSDE